MALPVVALDMSRFVSGGDTMLVHVVHVRTEYNDALHKLVILCLLSKSTDDVGILYMYIYQTDCIEH